MLYNMRSAAAKLGICYDQLSRLVRRKAIRCTRTPTKHGKRGHVFFTDEHLAEYIATNEVAPAIEPEPKPKVARSGARHGLDYKLCKGGKP
jgi:hypothetical protein